MIVAELGVKVEEKEFLDANGYYVAALNTIVLKSSLSRWEKNKTLLHELGHACKHHKEYTLYNLTFTLHSKMESEANKYMIKNLLIDYLDNQSLSINEVDCMKFMDYYGINYDYEGWIKKLILKKTIKAEKLKVV